MKTLEKMESEKAAIEYLDYYIKKFNILPENHSLIKEAFLAGYKEAFEIGLMKGAMQMQSLLDDDYHFVVKNNG
jgi:hypothetical protein